MARDDNPRPARAAGRFVALLASALAFSPGPTLAAPVETVASASGAWVVETIHRAHKPEERPALIVGLHGYGIDQGQMRTLVNLRPAIPHVYVAVRGRYRAPEGSYGWFAVAVEGEQIVFDAGELTRVVDEMAGLLPVLAERFEADPERIHVVGYSQGGTLALHMALATPDAAASFVGFAGALLPVAGAARPSPAPVLVGHGTRDPLISADDVAKTRARLEDGGRRVTVTTHTVPHVVSRAGREAIERWLERNDQPSSPSGDTL